MQRGVMTVHIKNHYNLWRITVGLNTTCQNSAWTAKATLLINYVTQNCATSIVPILFPLELSVIYNLTLELTTSYDLRLPKHRMAERQIPPPFTLFTLHYFLLRISSIHKIIEVKFHLKRISMLSTRAEILCHTCLTYFINQICTFTFKTPVKLEGFRALKLSKIPLLSNVQRWRVRTPIVGRCLLGEY